MKYEAYPKEKDTPSRKARKSARNKVFGTNSGLAALKRREKKAAKRATQLAAEAEIEENTEE